LVVAHKLCDVYGDVAGQSEMVDELFAKLKSQVYNECRVQKSLLHIVGQLDAIMTMAEMEQEQSREQNSSALYLLVPKATVVCQTYEMKLTTFSYREPASLTRTCVFVYKANLPLILLDLTFKQSQKYFIG
jgi:hypothetical protein